MKIIETLFLSAYFILKWKNNLNVRFVLIFSSRPSGWPLVDTLFAKNVWQELQIFLGYALYAEQSNDNDLKSLHAISVWKQLLTLSRLQKKISAQPMICQRNFVSNFSKRTWITNLAPSSHREYTNLYFKIVWNMIEVYVMNVFMLVCVMAKQLATVMLWIWLNSKPL